MLYAIITCVILYGHYVTSRLGIGLTIPPPDIRVSIADLNGLFRSCYFQLRYNRDDTVAMTCCSRVVEVIRITRICELVSTVGCREGMEGDTLADEVGRMNRQIQYIQRIYYIRAAYIDRINIRAGVVVAFAAPCKRVAFADILVPALHLHVRRVFLHTYA